MLMPALIEYIAKMVLLVSEGYISGSHATAITEVWKAFALFFASLAETARMYDFDFITLDVAYFPTGTRLLGVLLPTISLLLPSSHNSSSPVVAQSIKQLLSYATISPAAFKEAASKLDGSTRELLEQSVRKAVGGGAQAASVQSTRRRSF